MIRVLLLSSCVAMAAIVPASASDLGGKKQAGKIATAPIAAPQGAERWAGFYAGAQAGYGFGNSKWTDLDDGSKIDWDGRGFSGGVHLGYNHVINSWVVGVEADINATGIRGSISDGGDSADPADADPATLRSHVMWLGAVGPRIGYAVGNTLLYATGGLGFAGMRYKGTEDGGVGFRQNETRMGWAVGAGVEYALDKRWSVRADYRYFDLGRKNYPGVILASNGNETDELDPARTQERIHAIRVGLTYSFGNVR